MVEAHGGYHAKQPRQQPRLLPTQGSIPPRIEFLPRHPSMNHCDTAAATSTATSFPLGLGSLLDSAMDELNSFQRSRAAGKAYVGGTSGGVLFGRRDFSLLYPLNRRIRNAYTGLTGNRSKTLPSLRTRSR
ncbi:hypothetical protein [Pelagicoccus enzymogenes]|uniref:exo-rhamnogalacturonan lyase family protein n=1 Tax=Pelagicoccus enzymogenes TaxID=2773457 RepID=UPI003CCDDC8B